MKGFEHSSDNYSEYFRGFKFNDELDIVTRTKVASRDDVLCTVYIAHDEKGAQTQAVNKVCAFINEFFQVHNKEISLTTFPDRNMIVVESNKRLPTTNEVVKETKGSNYIARFKDKANIIFHRDFEIVSPNLFGKNKCNYIVTLFGYEPISNLLKCLESSYSEYEDIKKSEEKNTYVHLIILANL